MSIAFEAIPLKKVPEFSQKCYFTQHDAYQPFAVYISTDNMVTVYAIPDNYSINETFYKYPKRKRKHYYVKRVLKRKALNIFIGKSTKCQIEHNILGSKYDGNSILIQLSKLKYMFIGKFICRFVAKNPIVTFESPIFKTIKHRMVKLNAYPYSIDTKGLAYLHIAGFIVPKARGNVHPYHYFDKERVIIDCEKGISYNGYVQFKHGFVSTLNISPDPDRRIRHMHSKEYYEEMKAQHAWIHI